MTRKCTFGIPVDNPEGWLRLFDETASGNLIVEAGVGRIFKTITIQAERRAEMAAAVMKSEQSIPTTPPPARSGAEDTGYDLVTCDCSVAHHCPQGKIGEQARCSFWVKRKS